MSIDFNLSWEHEQIKEAMRGCLEPFKGRREELTKMVVHDKIFPQEVHSMLRKMEVKPISEIRLCILYF